MQFANDVEFSLGILRTKPDDKGKTRVLVQISGNGIYPITMSPAKLARVLAQGENILARLVSGGKGGPDAAEVKAEIEAALAGKVPQSTSKEAL